MNTKEDLQNIVEGLLNKISEEDTNSIPINGGELDVKSNIINKDVLRRVQKRTLNSIADALVNTYGPMGSNTLLLRGETKDGLVANYSKDGHKVLKALSFNGIIEMAIWCELVEITKYTEKEVGDGTTSAVMLSNAIFQRLNNRTDITETPYDIIRGFKKAVSHIQTNIKSHSREISIEDIYDICMISTNGNTFIAESISNIYKEFGLGVFISTSVSTTEENQIKIYDGLTISEGYSDPAYINNTKGTSVINNARIYAFKDPIDTPEMAGFFEQILDSNIMNPCATNGEVIPTVILAPKISRDVISIMSALVDFLYSFEKNGFIDKKPPILIITNLGYKVDIYEDIYRLCGCRPIAKYNDPKMQAVDIAKGVAPTLETITEFYGKCEEVVSNIDKTKFINPKEMFEYDEDGFIKVDEDGSNVHSPVYNNLVSFLTSALDNAINEQEDLNVIGDLRKRLQSLKANLVEFQIGGITISDRDNLKDLVEDAVKNCNSAAADGIGYAANFEGFRSAVEVIDSFEEDSIEYKLCNIILESYIDIIKILYSSVISDEDKVNELILTSLKEGTPFNLVSKEFDHKVLSSINGDIKILDAISKIMTMMITSNQALVQNAGLNNYL